MARLAKDVLARDIHTVELEAPDRVRRKQVLVLTGQAVGAPGDGERGDPLGRPREHGVDVGLGRMGDPQLLPGEPIPGPVAVWLCRERQSRNVRPSVGLGQRKPRHRPASGHLRDPLGLQHLAP